MAKKPLPSKPPERRQHLSGLDELARRLTLPVLRRYGFAQDALVARWPEVVGERFAEVTLPLKLSFAPQSRTGGTLTVQVEGPLATQFRHAESLVVERVNSFFGYAAVARLRLVQGPVPATSKPRTASICDRPPPELVQAMPDGPLKEALIQLAATFSVDNDVDGEAGAGESRSSPA